MAASGLLSVLIAIIIAGAFIFRAYWLAAMLLSIDLLCRGFMVMLAGFAWQSDTIDRPEVPRS